MRSFLLIAAQGLGDALEATPVVCAIKAAEPESVIDVVVLRGGPRDLFSALTGSVRTVFHYPYWDRGIGAFAAAIGRELPRLPRYDVSLLAYPAARPEYHLLAWLHRAKRRIAHEYWPGRAAGLQWLETDLVPVRPHHNVLRNLDLLAAAGIPAPADPAYLIPDSWRVPTADARRVAIHIGTVTHHGLDNKRWPADRFRELAARLSSRGYAVSVIAGPDELDASDAIVSVVAGATLVQGPIDAIARHLSSCAAAVTNDSGIGHLAAAVGTRVLALHGPTPVEGGPFGSNAVRFRPSSCPACFDPRLRNTSCKLGIDFACLKRDMSVDAVEAAFDALVATPAATA